MNAQSPAIYTEVEHTMKILPRPSCDGCAFLIADDNRSPLFSLLLPEELLLNGFDRADPIELLHIKPSVQTFDSVSCRASCELVFQGVTYFSRISHREGQLFDISITVENRSGKTLASPTLDVCQGLCYDAPDGKWCNEEFMSVPAGAGLAYFGQKWYTDVSVKRQRALSGKKWISIHPNPSDPILPEDEYFRSFGDFADCDCVALESINHTRTVFTAWSGPCYYRAPFPGYFCMHSLPALPDLADGDSAVVHGLCGIYPGNFDALSEYLKTAL